MKKKSRIFLLGMLALALTFGLVLLGCATSGDGAEPGRLTITGIPAEFNGKFVAFSEDTKITVGKTGIPIADGTVELPLYKESFFGASAYTGSDTYDIELCIIDTPEITVKENIPPSKEYPQGATRIIDFRTHYATFEAVTFENGVATVEWDALFQNAGSITITGIPAEYQGKFVVSELWKVSSNSRSRFNMITNNGVITGAGEFKLPLREKSGVFKKTIEAYTGSDTINITLTIFETASKEKSVVKKGFAYAVLRFDEAASDNGVVTLAWDNVKIAGSVELTGIPPQYNGKHASVSVDYSVSAVGGLIGGALGALTGGAVSWDGSSSDGKGDGTVRNGTLIVYYFGDSSTVTDRKDILVSIDSGETKEVNSLMGKQTQAIYHDFLFKSAPLEVGKASLNFSAGVKQK